MGIACSSVCADPGPKPGEATIIEEIRVITDEFEGYGYRRVGAELRHRGVVVNGKKVRTTRTTNSDHGGPIFPFIARKFEVHGPNQLWGEPFAPLVQAQWRAT